MEDIRDAAQYDDPLRRLEGRCQEKPLKDLDEDGPWDTLDGASAYELGLEVPASQELQDYKKGCIELGTHQLDDRVVFVRVPTGVDESALFRVGSDGSGTAMISAMTRDQQGVWQPLPDATWLAGKGQEFVIGRNPQSDVVLAAPTVSARHVSIRADQGLLTIESPATHGIELVIAREKMPDPVLDVKPRLKLVSPVIAEKSEDSGSSEAAIADARDEVEAALSQSVAAAQRVTEQETSATTAESLTEKKRVRKFIVQADSALRSTTRTYGDFSRTRQIEDQLHRDDEYLSGDNLESLPDERLVGVTMIMASWLDGKSVGDYYQQRVLPELQQSLDGTSMGGVDKLLAGIVDSLSSLRERERRQDPAASLELSKFAENLSQQTQNIVRRAKRADPNFGRRVEIFTSGLIFATANPADRGGYPSQLLQTAMLR